MFPIDKPDEVEELWPADRLDDLIAAVDFLVLCLPLNDSMRGIIDRTRLAKMKSHALLANVVRGPLVVTDDLIAALDCGQLAGAVMDVTEPEPLPPENRLWDFPNVLITPHVGGQSSWRIDNMTRMFCHNLRRRQAGCRWSTFCRTSGLVFPFAAAAIRSGERRMKSHNFAA